MRFNVTKTGYNEYDVALEYDTKQKLKQKAKVVYWATLATASGYFVYKIKQNHEENQD